MAGEIMKGVIIEFDFAAMNGAELLYGAAEKVLADNEIAFSPRIEAQYLAGGNCQGALTDYFNVVKTKKTPAKAAKDISEEFIKALTAAVPGAVTRSFVSFVKALSSKGVKVVIATRADIDAVKSVFEEVLDENVSLYQESSQTYGSVKWDAWRRACASNKLRNFTSVAIAGSGYSVKSALVAGMGALAVVNDHVAYQDFGGADDVVRSIDSKLADKVLSILKVS